MTRHAKPLRKDEIPEELWPCIDWDSHEVRLIHGKRQSAMRVKCQGCGNKRWHSAGRLRRKDRPWSGYCTHCVAKYCVDNSKWLEPSEVPIGLRQFIDFESQRKWEIRGVSQSVVEVTCPRCGKRRWLVVTAIRRAIKARCWTARCRPCMRQAKTAFNVLYDDNRSKARARKYRWDLSKQDFHLLTQQPCRYCGALPSRVCRKNKHGRYVYNGLDRVDNNLGYTLENVVPCCWPCNRAKGTSSKGEFLGLVEAIHRRMKMGLT